MVRNHGFRLRKLFLSKSGVKSRSVAVTGFQFFQRVTNECWSFLAIPLTARDSKHSNSIESAISPVIVELSELLIKLNYNECRCFFYNSGIEGDRDLIIFVRKRASGDIDRHETGLANQLTNQASFGSIFYPFIFSQVDIYNRQAIIFSAPDKVC